MQRGVLPHTWEQRCPTSGNLSPSNRGTSGALITGVAIGPGGGVGEWDWRWDSSASGKFEAQLLAYSNLYLAGNAPQRNAEDLPLPASVPECTVTGGTPGPLARVNSPTPHSQLHVGPGACRWGNIFKPRPGVTGRRRGTEGGGVGRAWWSGVGAPRAPVRRVEAASARESKTSVMCHSPLLADCSWIKD